MSVRKAYTGDTVHWLLPKTPSFQLKRVWAILKCLNPHQLFLIITPGAVQHFALDFLVICIYDYLECRCIHLLGGHSICILFLCHEAQAILLLLFHNMRRDKNTFLYGKLTE